MSNQTLLCVAKRAYTLFLTQTRLPDNSPRGLFNDRQRYMKRPLGVHCRSFWENLPQVLSGPVQGKTQGAESSADGTAADHEVHHPPQLLHVTVIWWRPLIWFLFWAQFKYEQHCFLFWESRSMDICTQSHINYKQTLKITFLFDVSILLHPNSCFS